MSKNNNICPRCEVLGRKQPTQEMVVIGYYAGQVCKVCWEEILEEDFLFNKIWYEQGSEINFEEDS